jgi:type I restriction enzyme, S subunit
LIGFEVKPGNFIISCSGTIGKIAQLPDCADRGIINQVLLKLTIDYKLIIPKFFLVFFRSNQFQKKLLKETRGSAIKNINSVEDMKL